MRTLFWLFVIATLLAMLGCTTLRTEDEAREERANAPLCSVEQTDAFFTSVMTEDNGVQLFDFYSDDFEDVNHCSIGSI